MNPIHLQVQGLEFRVVLQVLVKEGTMENASVKEDPNHKWNIPYGHFEDGEF